MSLDDAPAAAAADSRTVVLRTRDGAVYELPATAARRSLVLANALDMSMDAKEAVATIDVASCVGALALKYVVRYLVELEEETMPFTPLETRLVCDALSGLLTFSQVRFVIAMASEEKALGLPPHELRLDVLFLANYLDIKPLHELMSVELAHTVRFLTTAGICKYLDVPVPKDEEYAKICNEYVGVLSEFGVQLPASPSDAKAGTGVGTKAES